MGRENVRVAYMPMRIGKWAGMDTEALEGGESPTEAMGIIESMVKAGALCPVAARVVANVVT